MDRLIATLLRLEISAWRSKNTRTALLRLLSVCRGAGALTPAHAVTQHLCSRVPTKVTVPKCHLKGASGWNMNISMGFSKGAPKKRDPFNPRPMGSWSEGEVFFFGALEFTCDQSRQAATWHGWKAHNSPKNWILSTFPCQQNRNIYTYITFIYNIQTTQDCSLTAAHEGWIFAAPQRLPSGPCVVWYLSSRLGRLVQTKTSFPEESKKGFTLELSTEGLLTSPKLQVI